MKLEFLYWIVALVLAVAGGFCIGVTGRMPSRQFRLNAIGAMCLYIAGVLVGMAIS